MIRSTLFFSSHRWPPFSGSVGQAGLRQHQLFPWMLMPSTKPNALVGGQGLRTGRTLSINWPFLHKEGTYFGSRLRKVAQPYKSYEPLLTIYLASTSELCGHGFQSHIPGGAAHGMPIRAVFTTALPHIRLWEKRTRLGAQATEPSMPASAVPRPSEVETQSSASSSSGKVGCVKFSPELLERLQLDYKMIR